MTMGTTRRSRYPLDALLRLRREIRKRRELELAGAVARLGTGQEAAAEARRRAEEGRAAAERAAAILVDPGTPHQQGADRTGAPVLTGAATQIDLHRSTYTEGRHTRVSPFPLPSRRPARIFGA